VPFSRRWTSCSPRTEAHEQSEITCPAGRRVAPPASMVVLGFDMETDIGSFTPFYEGVKHGTPNILRLLKKHSIRATFFWTGHAAENNPVMVRRVACRRTRDRLPWTLSRDARGDPLFPLPNNWAILPSGVEGRLRIATDIVRKTSGEQP